MILLFLILSSWMMSMIFMCLKHPLSLGFIILMQTIIISMESGLLNVDFWFSYILFLIMIGGMLVLFIYMTNVASNEKFKFSTKLTLFILIFNFLNMLLLLSDMYMLMMNSFSWNFMEQFMYSINLSMNKFLNKPSMLILMMLMIYLLVTLIAIVKIINPKMGPLRTSM